MADTSIVKKEVTFTFGTGVDQSTRKHTINNFAPDEILSANVATWKTRIKAFNDSDAALLSSTFFSNADDNGNVTPVSGISAAAITKTDKTVIYAKTESARLAAIEEGDSNG